MSEGLRASVVTTVGTMRLDAALDADRGETIGVLGPNGAGKSTLLRALAGLQRLERGIVEVDGRVLDDPVRGIYVSPEARPVAMVFQDYLLFPHLSALDNVAFGLRSRGVRRAEAGAQARDWLTRVGLADHGGSKPSQLSGGQAQRVALARALVTRPRLLLLDEPLAALDATTRLATRHDIRRHLIGYDGVAVVVTHDPVDAAVLADRLVVVEDGHIVQQGTLAEISARPRSAYVADLVGVNLLRGRGHGSAVRLAGDIAIAAARDGGTVEGDVFAVIHPRSVALHHQRPEGTPRNVWHGEVRTIDREGERARVRVRLDRAGVGVEGGDGVDAATLLVAEITSAALAEMALEEGDLVWLSVKATEVSVFPA